MTNFDSILISRDITLATKDEMVGWHHRLNGHEFEQSLGDREREVLQSMGSQSKVMSLLLNMLSRLVITFLPRNKRLLISWLQSRSAVILEPRKIKSDTVSTVSPCISHEVMGLDAMIFVF